MAEISVSAAAIAEAVAGRAAAVNAIVRALERPFYALARRILLDPDDAEDATQESLLRVVTHLSQFDGRARFSTWAWRIALNQCLDFKQQRHRLALLTEDTFAAELADGLAEAAPERMEDAYLLEQVKLGCGSAMLATLDGAHRAAYVLGEILELAGDEAAEVLEITPETFRKRLSRARVAILSVLADNCGLFDGANPCRCHRRLDRARQLGRVDVRGGEALVDLARLRPKLAAIPELRRAVAFFHADPHPPSKGDFVEEVRKLLAAAVLS